MHSALLNNDAIKLANEKIVLQKGILAIGQKKLEKYAESSRLLAVAQSQDALAFKNFTKACRKYMDGESSTDSLERDNRRIMTRVEVMLLNGTGDVADTEVGTAFGSAATSPLVRPLGVTPQMESEWDEVEDERPSITLRVSAMRLYSTGNDGP